MKLILPTLLTVIALALAGCMGGSGGPDDTPQGGTTTFKQAGSSTVLPVAQAWAEEFPKVNSGARFVVSGGGTGAGFKQFCRGEIDISDASRPIKSSEATDCANSSITPFEIQVAIDALAVVVGKKNTFATDLTVNELNRIWTANVTKQANKWSDLRPEWPAEKIQLYGPGTDSGTFDYFIEVIIHPFDGKESKGRSDYTPSEDDNILVQGIESSAYTLGYFGFAYVAENADKVRPLAIDEGKGGGAIAPNAQTVEAGTYKPLARPIFMYTNGKPTGVLAQYFQWGVGDEGQALVEEVGYLPLPAGKQQAMLAKLG